MAEVLKVANIGDNDIHIHNAIIIPKDATNGDMIKAMFPNGIPKDVIWMLQGDKGIDWWNEPYKREVEE